MDWKLKFISEENFKNHVRATIMKYGEKLKSYDLKRFNSNLIDPIKLLFDKSVYRTSWEEIVNNEIFRQRDKSNNNDIGYFHQNIFSFFKGCEVPQAGWDVIYKNPDGIQMPDGDVVHTLYVEMKNKHNTMNSASSAKTYIKNCKNPSALLQWTCRRTAFQNRYKIRRKFLQSPQGPQRNFEKEETMGGFFGVASKKDCVFDLFFGVDYHTHLGTRRGGMAV